MKEFGKGQKSIDLMNTRSLMDSMDKLTEKKSKAKQLKENGNAAFQQKAYSDAENFYSAAIELDSGSRLLWTNRAACRNTMKKYDEAISDCNTALSIDPECSRTIAEKGNALLGLKRFDEAKEVYESLRSLGKDASADFHLKKLHDVQDRVSQLSTVTLLRSVRIKISKKFPKAAVKKTKKQKRRQK